MSVGPLENFVFPGVYTQTYVDKSVTSASTSLRYAALIGVGVETVEVTAVEMVRGSSSSAANIIAEETPIVSGSKNVIDGVNVDFYTKFYPLVSDDGKGTYTTSVEDVIVKVNDEQVAVSSITPAVGLITLVNPPEEGDTVSLSYYFKLRDQYVENEDLSNQADGASTTFKVKSARIVDGSNGGTSATSDIIGSETTTEITKDDGTYDTITVDVISVLVNGISAVISSIDGGKSTFTLKVAPEAGDIVTVNYFTNHYQNTYDILPAANVTSIEVVGFDPGRKDFFNKRDYVLSAPNQIHWGNSVSVASGVINEVDSLFSDKVSTTLVEHKLYKIVTEETSNVKVWTLPYDPVRGDGNNTSVSNYPSFDYSAESVSDPQYITAYSVEVDTYGVYDLSTIVKLTITKVDGREITIKETLTDTQIVVADFSVNKLVDDEWTVTCLSEGGVGVGAYKVVGKTYGTARQVTLPAEVTTTNLVSGDLDDVYIAPTRRSILNETIVITDDDNGSTFTVSSYQGEKTAGISGETGSVTTNDSNVGRYNQTYIDPVTGFIIALKSLPAGLTEIEISVTSIFTVKNGNEYSIPGIKLIVDTTTGVGENSTAVVNTYNMMNDIEPDVGDVYYVTFYKERQDYSVKYVESFDDFETKFGSLSQSNPLSMAAYLYFENGGPALAVKQLKKSVGSSDASVSDYKDAIDLFDEPLSNGTRPCLLNVLNTSTSIISKLKTSNALQSSIRFKNERTSWCGVAKGTTPDDIISLATGLQSELISLAYPDSAIITVPNSKGVDQDIIVGGEYIAAAMSGLDTNLTYDVATPFTNKTLSGIKRLGRSLTGAKAALIAQNGVTVLESKSGITKILMALTTDMTSVLTRTTRIIEIKHYVQRGVRSVCGSFIGNKSVGAISGNIKTTLTTFFTSLVKSEIITKFTSITVTQDEEDPSIYLVTVKYVPMFGVDWIVVTHYMHTNL